MSDNEIKVPVPTSELRPNSNKSKEEAKEQIEDKHLEKVVTGDVIIKKQSKAASMFKDLMNYLFRDVLVPAAKNTASDMVSSATQRLLFGESGATQTPRYQRLGTRSYTGYSNITPRSYNDVRRPAATVNNALDDIILPDREQANAVLEHLDLIVDKYDFASVADLKSLLGVKSDYTDNKWGWSNMRFATVQQVREGWLLNLPELENK